MFSSIACGCSVSTVKISVPLANLYRLQPVATDSKKTMYSVSTVLLSHLQHRHVCRTIIAQLSWLEMRNSCNKKIPHCILLQPLHLLHMAKFNSMLPIMLQHMAEVWEAVGGSRVDYRCKAMLPSHLGNCLPIWSSSCHQPCLSTHHYRGVTGIPCSRHYHCCRGHIVRAYAEAMYSHAPL